MARKPPRKRASRPAVHQPFPGGARTARKELIVSQAERGRIAYEAREALDLTQRAFADLVGVTQTTVARWEKPNAERPNYAPSDIALALLRLVREDPKLARRVLGPKAKPKK